MATETQFGGQDTQLVEDFSDQTLLSSPTAGVPSPSPTTTVPIVPPEPEPFDRVVIPPDGFPTDPGDQLTPPVPAPAPINVAPSDDRRIDTPLRVAPQDMAAATPPKRTLMIGIGTIALGIIALVLVFAGRRK